MHCGRVAVLVLATILATSWSPTSVAQDTSEDALEPILYLGERRDNHSSGNFTTFRPTAEFPNTTSPALSQPGAQRMEWHWWLPALPNATELAAGTSVDVTAYLGNLGGSVPQADPVGALDQTGEYRVTFEIISGSRAEPLGSGTTSFFANPLDPPAVVEVRGSFPLTNNATIPATTDDISALPLVGLNVILHAAATPSAGPQALTGAASTPASLRLPGFPIEGFRSWEEGERASSICLDAVLRQEPCPGDGSPDTSGTSADAPILGGLPGIGFIVFITGLTYGAVVAGRRIIP